MYCPNCGKQIQDDVKYCPNCGKLVSWNTNEQQEVRNKQKLENDIAEIRQKRNVTIVSGVVAGLAIVVAGTAFFAMKKESRLSKTETTMAADSLWEDWNESKEENDDTSNSAVVQAETLQSAGNTTAQPTETNISAEETSNQISMEVGPDISFGGLEKIPIEKDNTWETSCAAKVDEEHVYYAWSAFDGRPETSWQDGRDDDGIGESISAKFGGFYGVKGLSFLLGNHRSQDWYVKNNRPKKLKITLGDQVFEANFSDEMRTQYIVFSSPVDADRINIEVEEVYPGSNYRDTVIAEVGVYQVDE